MSITVAVCVATYRRPILLARLLDSLASLVFSKAERPRLLLIVIDNDQGESARAVVQPFVGKFDELIYEVEPERSIPTVRNRGIGHGLARGADYIAIVDDDEYVCPRWLDELLDTQGRFTAEVIQGAVSVSYESTVPRWVIEGGFFERVRHPTGATLTLASTNNVLIARSLLCVPQPFDAGFGLNGSDDTLFFMNALKAGARLVWSDEATVYEQVPLERASVRWLLRRAFRGGNGYVLCERSVKSGVGWKCVRLVSSIARIGQGLLELLPGAFRGRAACVRALGKVSLGAGGVAALLGMRFEEYRVVQGH